MIRSRVGHFASGSMGPKVDAACRFVEAGVERAVVTSLDRIADPAAGIREAGDRACVDTGTETFSGPSAMTTSEI